MKKDEYRMVAEDVGGSSLLDLTDDMCVGARRGVVSILKFESLPRSR